MTESPSAVRVAKIYSQLCGESLDGGNEYDRAHAPYWRAYIKCSALRGQTCSNRVFPWSRIDAREREKPALCSACVDKITSRSKGDVRQWALQMKK